MSTPAGHVRTDIPRVLRDEPGPSAQERVGGAAPWRRSTDGGLEVLLVRRPGADTWTWPAVRLRGDEPGPAGAVRAVAEKTGHTVTLGPPLPTSANPRDGAATEPARYWSARLLADALPRPAPRRHPAEESAWVGVDDARHRLHRPGDGAALDVLAERADGAGTWPVVVLRHGQARPRDAWSRPDHDRPLVAAGRRQAAALVPLLAAWQPRHVLCSPWDRCTQTLEPYAAGSGVRVRTKRGLSEDGFARRPAKVAHHVRRLLRHGEAGLLCTHRPVLEGVMAALAAACEPRLRPLIPTHEPWLAAAEVLVAHVGAGPSGEPAVVAVERHRV